MERATSLPIIVSIGLNIGEFRPDISIVSPDLPPALCAGGNATWVVLIAELEFSREDFCDTVHLNGAETKRHRPCGSGDGDLAEPKIGALPSTN